MATAAADSLQQTVAALNALYNAPSNSAKKEANLWLEDFQAKVQAYSAIPSHPHQSHPPINIASHAFMDTSDNVI